MKKLILALALLATPAMGADLPAKALSQLVPATPACLVTYCVGFYAGLDVTGNGANMDIIGSGIGGSLNAAGTEIGFHGGYRAWNGTIYLGGEVGCSYDVSTSVAVLGASPSDRLRCMELAKLGGALSALVGGQQQFPIPPALQSSFMSFYGVIGGTQRYGATGFVGGVGAEFIIMPKLTMNLEYLHSNFGGGGAIASPTLAAKDENLFRLLVSYNF